MDRVTLKTRAKEVMARDRVICAVVTFILWIVGSGSDMPSLRINFQKIDKSSLENFASEFEQGFEGNFDERLMPIIMPAITAAIIASLFAIVLKLFLGSVISVGGARYFLKLRKGENTGIAELAGNFKDGNYMNIFVINLFAYIKILLWSLLFVIPGIVKNLEYFPLKYLLATRPDLDRGSAFEMSRNLMNGKKLDLFILNLSFLGWEYLSLFTCGLLGIFYVNPYKEATFAEFFAEIRADGIRNGIITEADIPDYGSPFGTQNDPFGFNASNFGGSEYGSGTSYNAFTGTYQNSSAYQRQPFDASDGGNYSAPEGNANRNSAPYDPFAYYRQQNNAPVSPENGNDKTDLNGFQ